MGKSLYIAEKPSVAQEFAKALKLNTRRQDGYLESEDSIVTWCVGHLVTMSYPEEYDPALKKWSLQTLPFIPTRFKYEVIPSVAKQYKIVAGLLNRPDVETIYVCTDSGREGEYIYRLVEQQAQVHGKNRRRVWIDSQTEEEILRGIREAKDISEYDNLAAAAYLRAKEDYLMGINFSRVLTLRYGNSVTNYLGGKYQAISVGRVMTCVLGMVVRREREIRAFVKTPFYRVVSSIALEGESFEGEWRAVEGSRYFQSPVLYKENGFKKKEDAHKYMELVADEIIRFARAQIDAGADIIAISDPSGTGEILGPKLFEEYAVHYINRIIDHLQAEKMGVIVHICGQMRNVYAQVEMIHSDVLSFDSCVAMSDAKKHLKKHVLMGNVSTWTLEFGKPEKVEQLAVKCWRDGSGIISPACGLGTKSPLTNIQAIRLGIRKATEEKVEV